MNKFIRSVFRLLFFAAPYVCAVTVYPLYADNLLYEFGPKTDTTLIFTASAGEENQANTATVQLHDLIGKLSSHAPDMHTIVAITKNDVSELPPDIPVKRYEGTKQLIRGLSAYSNPIVCLIAPGKAQSVQLIAGTKGITPPSWLLQSVYGILRSEHIPVDFYSDTVLFHKLGWLPDDPALALYAAAQLPVIKLETNVDLTAFFETFSKVVSAQNNKIWDSHYFIWKADDSLIIIGEKLIVRILIISSMLILLWLIMFSFLFGKKRAQHIKDLFILWWMPIYFFSVNCAGFYVSTQITKALFYLRFSAVDNMNAFPLTALAVKYGFVLFFIFTFTAFNKFIPLPANRYIYGFMANAVCLINIFIFSVINLSFSITFLAIYVISVIAYRSKNSIVQLCSIGALLLPLEPFISHIITYHSVMFDSAFAAMTTPSFILVPFDLLLIRLGLSLDKKRKQTGIQRPRRFRIPLQCAVSGVVFCILMLWVFFMPVSQHQGQHDFILVQKITNDGQTVFKKYRSIQQEEPVASVIRKYDDAENNAIDRLLTVETNLNNYFERSIGQIVLRSAVRAEAVSIKIQADNGIAVFEADLPFDQNSSGDTAVFVSTPRPQFPFAVHFSGKKTADLTVTVTLWSKENPFGIALPPAEQLERAPLFLLKLQKTVRLTAAEDVSL